jgi:hypothetical protein
MWAQALGTYKDRLAIGASVVEIMLMLVDCRGNWSRCSQDHGHDGERVIYELRTLS